MLDGVLRSNSGSYRIGPAGLATRQHTSIINSTVRDVVQENCTQPSNSITYGVMVRGVVYNSPLVSFAS